MSETAAPMPVATKTNKEKNQERIAKLKAAQAANKAAKAAGTTPKAPRVKKEKVVRPCGCGCSGQTTAFFVPGHDARFKGWLVKIERGKMEVKDLPPAIQKQYKWVKRGVGMIPTANYKGEVHKGYLPDEEVAES